MGSIISFLSSLVDFVVNFLKSVVWFVTSLPNLVSILTSSVAYAPSFILPFLTISISAMVLLAIFKIL